MEPTGKTATADHVLAGAAETALRAPSIYNTQPWRWVVRGDTLELWADRGRQLATTDPEGRMLTISCGIALDHVLVALAAAGVATEVERLPEDGGPDLLARITRTGDAPTTGRTLQLFRAITDRRTDRRPFTDDPVSDEVVDLVRGAVERHGVHLTEIDAGRMVRFQVTVARADEIDDRDPAYRAERAEWTHRPAEAGDGVGAAGAVAEQPRRVPVRSFFPDEEQAAAPTPGTDRGARYLLIWSGSDEPSDWLAAGEATSATLLEATAAGVAASPITEIIEVPATRALMHRLLDNLGEAQIALRIGIPAATAPVPATPRRASGDVVRVEE